MPRYSIVAKSASTLESESTPGSGSDLEALPWDWFDTNTVAFANAAANPTVNFFTGGPGADPTLTNMEAPSMLPDPVWTEIAGIMCDIQAIPAGGATFVSNPLSDIAEIIKHQRYTFEFKLANKSYGVFPLSLAHCSGGEVGFLASTTAAGGSAGTGNNGQMDGGWWVDGAVQIPSQQNFRVILAGAPGGALALNQTPMPVRMNIWGPTHRRVL